MTIIKEEGIREFQAWSGAVETQDTIINAGKADEFDAMIEEPYPDGIGETELNDLLWFDDEWIYETLDIREEDDEEEEDDE